MDIKKIFEDFSNAFSKKIDKDFFIKLQFELTDLTENNIWQLDVHDGKVNVYNEEKIVPEETFTLSVDTLKKLYNNELSPLTAFSGEPNTDGVMCSLIDLKYKKQDKFITMGDKLSDETIDFIDRLHKSNDFFNKNYPTKIIVKDENCVKLHNVKATALFSDFGRGILHAFFTIKKNEALKQYPIEFSVYVLNGKGIMRIGANEYSIAKNEYYHVKPEDYAIFENSQDEALDILYLGIKNEVK